MIKPKLSNELESVWLEGLPIPFHEMGGEGLERFCEGLLKLEYPDDTVMVYGQSGDLGRDITRTKADGSYKELIQCKNYARKISKSGIAAELAKLSTNICSTKIKNPDKVVFWVPKGLYNPAKDLLSNKDEWAKIARNALITHLDKEPSPDLLAFALSWWPSSGFDVCDAVCISERAKKYPDFVGQYVKVQTFYKTSEEKFESFREDIISDFQKLLSERDSKQESIEEIIDNLRKLHPNFEFEATITSKDKREIKFRLRPEIPAFELGTVSFPQNESGKIGQLKLDDHLKRGTFLKLEKGEFEFEPNPGVPLITKEATSFEAANVLRPSQVVILESLFNGKVLSRVEHTNFTPIRGGAEEWEFLLDGGFLAGSIRVVIQLGPVESAAASFRLDLTSINSRHALTTWQLMRDLTSGASLRVNFENENRPLLFNCGVRQEASSLFDDEVGTFLRDLVSINEAFDRDLRCTAELDRQTIIDAAKLANIVKTGAEDLGTGTLSVTLNSATATSMASAYCERGSLPLNFSFPTSDVEFMGEVFHLGSTLIVCSKSHPVGGAEAILNAALSEPVNVELVCEGITCRYEEFATEDQWSLPI
jgi:Restriction endonuclease